MPIASDKPSDKDMRRALLRCLERICHKESKTADPLTIACLRGQYNESMGKIEHQESRSRVDFITRLPPELSSYCLRQSLSNRHYAKRLLDLTMVSMGWSDFIISAKELWVYVDVKASQGDAMATLAVFLELSGSRSLHVTIWDDPGDEWDEYKLLLARHQQRIDTIHFKQENGLSSSRRFSIACNVTQTFEPLNRPIEVHLGDQPTLSLHHPSELERLLQSSSHYVLKGLDFPISILSKNCKILRQLGSVTTGQTLDDLGPILPLMTDLTSIWLRPDESPQYHIPEVGSVTTGQGWANEATTPLPVEPPSNPIRLTNLTSFQAFDLPLSSLVSSVAMTLSDLTVAISRSQWMALLACLRLATNLKGLSIELRGPMFGDGEMTELASLTPILGLTALSLQFQGWEEPPGKTTSDSTLFGTVSNVFSVIYPSVLSFKMEHCDLRIDHAVLRVYLESLKSLEYLGIWEAVVGQILEIVPILLPSLKRLDCECALIPYIDAPALEQARISGEEGLVTAKFSSLLAVHIWNISRGFHKSLDYLSHESFPSLQSIILDLPISRRHWKMPSLPSLRKIKITSNNRLDQSATMLCISFLYNPHHCPVLEEIELNGFVEWDVLLLMLERRNFRTDDVKRISTLKIPLTPPSLENHLESLLRGIYTERPSNEELSTEAIAEALCDVDTPGCIYCIKNMIPGCKKDIAPSHGRFFRLDRFYEGYPEPPSTLDHDCLEWICGGTLRTEKWKAQWVSFGATYRRRKACGRYPSLMTNRWSLLGSVD